MKKEGTKCKHGGSGVLSTPLATPKISQDPRPLGTVMSSRLSEGQKSVPPPQKKIESIFKI